MGGGLPFRERCIQALPSPGSLGVEGGRGGSIPRRRTDPFRLAVVFGGVGFARAAAFETRAFGLVGAFAAALPFDAARPFAARLPFAAGPDFFARETDFFTGMSAAPSSCL
jgi:hypothetical protein